jgi:hypothetical protein
MVSEPRLLSVENRAPNGSVALAIHFADAPAGGTAGVSSHAFTIHEMGTACFADRNDQGVWLEEGCG